VIFGKGMRMSDLIDREALLRQIDIDSEGEPGYYGDTWKFIDTIKSMPPAELGTNLASLGTDCISRQQAIDALERAKQNIRHNIERAIGRAICEILDEVENGIKQLPPIQPKRIRGQWSIKGQAIDTVRGYWAKCSACGHSVFGGGNYCSNCGSYNKGEVIT
jgi:hypothetical protein